MKIGLIGPNYSHTRGLEINDRKALLSEVAKIIVKYNHEVVLTPDKNSLIEYFADEYIRLGGRKVWLIVPTKEPGYENYLSTKSGEIISCKDWDRQADEFNRQSDIFICTGYAWGAMKEIACAQYFNKKQILILNEFIRERLPEELNFLLEYTSINNIKEYLK